MNQEMYIIKSNGDKARFSEQKLQRSLEKSGASPDQVRDIIHEVRHRFSNGASSSEIYKLAFSLLKNSSRSLAARYNLKRAIMELGPSGFPFERYIAGLLRVQGYTTQVGQVLQGKCVSHEIDVIAGKGSHAYMIECKYHNTRGIFCDVKVPLYIHARFKDLEEQFIKAEGPAGRIYQAWVVTNTKFSHDALKYGICAGLNLLSWDYPGDNSLRAQIDSLALYPVTCLTSLTRLEKQRLLEKNIVLCRELADGENILKEIGIKQGRLDIVMQEAGQLAAALASPLNQPAEPNHKALP